MRVPLFELRLLGFVGVSLVSGLIAPAFAQAMGDPTRPANVWLAVQPALAGGVAAAVEPERTPEAQIVVTGPSRTFALVDGEPVHPGQVYKGSRLLAIDAAGVEWQTGSKRARTRMSPRVEKTPPASYQAPAAGAKPKQKIVNGGAQ